MQRPATHIPKERAEKDQLVRFIKILSFELPA
jgi:hypothetical protein